MSILRYDSKLITKANEVTDFLLVNIVYLVCCIPIFTIGAAKSALYGTYFSYIRYQDGDVRVFWRMFKENFRQATGPWLLVLLSGVFLTYSFWLLFRIHAPGFVLFVIVLAILILAFCIIHSQFFFVLARFECTFRHLLGNSVLIALAHPIKSLLVLVLQALPYALFLLETDLFLFLMPVWLLIYFSLQGYFGARIMNRVYQNLEDESREEKQ